MRNYEPGLSRCLSQKRQREEKCHRQELHINFLDTMSEICALKQENNFSHELFKLKHGLVKHQQLNEKLIVGDLRKRHFQVMISRYLIAFLR